MRSPRSNPRFLFELPELVRDLGWKPLAPFTEKVTEVDGFKVVERFLDGEGSAELPIVFIHGLVISSLYFIPLAERMQGFAELHLPDQPGFGRSTGPDDAPTVEEMAARMIRWMDAAGITRCHIVANSLGCQIGAEMAVHSPERFETLTLIGPTTDPEARTLFSQAWRIIWDAPHEPPRLWINHILDQWRAGCRKIWQMIFNMLRHRMEDCLPEVQQPVLLIRGRKDPTVPARWMNEVAKLLPNAVSRTLPGWHCVHYSDPLAVAEEIRSFIQARTRVRAES